MLQDATGESLGPKCFKSSMRRVLQRASRFLHATMCLRIRNEQTAENSKVCKVHSLSLCSMRSQTNCQLLPSRFSSFAAAGATTCGISLGTFILLPSSPWQSAAPRMPYECVVEGSEHLAQEIWEPLLLQPVKNLKLNKIKAR